MLCTSLCITAGFVKGGIQKPRLAVTVTVNFSFRIFSTKSWCIYSRKPTVQWSEVTSCPRIWSNGSSQGRNRHLLWKQKLHLFNLLVFSPSLFRWSYPYHCLSEPCTGPADGMTQRKRKQQHGLKVSQTIFEIRAFPQGVVLCETAFKIHWSQLSTSFFSAHRNS